MPDETSGTYNATEHSIVLIIGLEKSNRHLDISTEKQKLKNSIIVFL